MAKASIWLKVFDRERDFVAGKPMRVSGRDFLPGDPFDKSLVSTRRLRQLYEQRKVRMVETETVVPLPMLYGSSILASTYEIAGKTVQLGEIVAAAHDLSGLSADEWNDLPDDDREALLRAELDRLLAQVPGDDIPENDESEPPVDPLDHDGDGNKGGAVNIPEDWASKPFLSIKAIAKQISPDLDAKAKKPEIVAIIEAELARRSGAPANKDEQGSPVIEIPDGWEKLSWTERVALANSLKLVEETIADAEEADALIELEIERRNAGA